MSTYIGDRHPSSRLTDLLALSYVPRWAIVNHSRFQSVADHTFRVLVIAQELSYRLRLGDGGLSREAMIAILTHDADECRTGDISSPAKSKMTIAAPSQFCPWLTDIAVSDDEARVIALADQIEAFDFISRHGIGQHAQRAASSIHVKIIGMCPEEWSGTVGSMMVEMRDEEGR